MHALRPKVAFLVIGRLQNRAFYYFVFGNLFSNREVRDTGKRGNQIVHVQSMVDKRGLTNRANVHASNVKMSYKTQHGRIAIYQAIFAAIRHRFIPPQKKKKKKKKIKI